MFSGYVKSRRGILEHLMKGWMTKGEYLAFDILVKLADPGSGIWSGSAKALAGTFNYSTRQARHLLESLEAKRYLKRFPNPGRHCNYPILINKYIVTQGGRLGLRLNATKSRSYRNPVYEKCQHNGAMLSVEGASTGANPGASLAPRREKRELRIEKKKETPPASPAFRALTDWLIEQFQAAEGKKPTWGKKDYTQLAKFRKEHPKVTDDEIQRRFLFFLGSNTQFFQGYQLWKFCGSFDSFMHGPVIRPLTSAEEARRDAGVGRSPR